MSYDKDRNKDYPTRTFKKRSYGNDDESYNPRHNDYSGGDRGDTRNDYRERSNDQRSNDRGDYRERNNDQRSNDRGDYQQRNDYRERSNDQRSNNDRGDYQQRNDYRERSNDQRSNDRGDYQQRNDYRERSNNRGDYQQRNDYRERNNDRGDYQQRNDYRERNNNNDRGDYQQRNDYRRERPSQEDNEYRWNREGANLGNASGYPNNNQQRYYSRQPRPYQQQQNNNPYQQRPYQQRPYQPRPYQQGGGSGGGGGHYQQRDSGYQQRQYDNGGGKNNPFVRRQPPMQRDNRYDRPQPYEKRPSPDGKMSMMKKKAPARFMKKQPVSPKHFISLPRALRSHQFASRQIAIDFIKNARVQVNSAVMSDPNARVNAKRDRLMVDAMPLAANRLTYIVVNKPKGLVPSKEMNVETVHSLVPHTEHWHFPAGRLNKAATGLVILTNDPSQSNYMNSPFKQLEKEYHVKVHRAPKKTEITAITKGLRALQSDEFQKDVRVEVLQKNARSCWLSITVHEGKMTELRSVLKESGLEVLSFHRYRIGSITTNIISAGSWKQMNELEIAQLTNGDTMNASFLFKKLERVTSRHKSDDGEGGDEDADHDDEHDDADSDDEKVSDEAEQTQD